MTEWLGNAHGMTIPVPTFTEYPLSPEHILKPSNRSMSAIEDSKDTESDEPASQLEKPSVAEDSNVLDFEDDNDPANPLNWSRKRKWAIVMLLSALSTIGTTATLTCTPAVPQILAEFGSHDAAYSTFLVSVWELGEGVGPFFVGPLSEHFGRLPVWHISNALFALCSVACALSNSIGMLIAFRFLNGLVLASITLSPTIVSDLFVPGERATAMSIAAMTPVVGPTFGPMIGSFLSHRKGWRWVFWIIAIAIAAFEIPSLLILRETYKVKILETRARSRLGHQGSSMASWHGFRGPRKRFTLQIFLRTFKIWYFYPAVFILALYLAIAYGYQYLVFTTFTEVLEGQYAFPSAEVGIAFIGIGIGSVLGMIAVGVSSDRYVKRRELARGAYRPEDRLPPTVVGTVVMAAGLFLYGWTAEKRVQWMAPIIGTAIQGFGLAVILISTQAYLVDAFPIHAASASAAGTILRSVAGAVVPLAGPPLYKGLNLGWGNSLLGFTAIAFLPVPFLLMSFGERSRTHGAQRTKL